MCPSAIAAQFLQGPFFAEATGSLNFCVVSPCSLPAGLRDILSPRSRGGVWFVARALTSPKAVKHTEVLRGLYIEKIKSVLRVLAAVSVLCVCVCVSVCLCVSVCVCVCTLTAFSAI